MGDRFYQAQVRATGNCPGASKLSTIRKNRKMWTDEKKAEVIAAYEDAQPTPENSLEIVKEIAEEYEESPNGVRMILTKAGVYVKKAAAASKATSSNTTASTRVSKADAIEALSVAIRAAGKEVDEEILSKLTGKAAQYFTTLLATA